MRTPEGKTEMEQYHSEIKTDLCAEQFPSGKFDTNELVPELIQPAYNLLRMIGQASLGISDIPMKRTVKRRTNHYDTGSRDEARKTGEA